MNKSHTVRSVSPKGSYMDKFKKINGLKAINEDKDKIKLNV
jgi:hypothetical protein